MTPDSQAPFFVWSMIDPLVIGWACMHRYTWGSNKNGRLGTDQVPAMTAEPTKLHLPEELNVTRVLDVACGYDHTLLLVE